MLFGHVFVPNVVFPIKPYFLKGKLRKSLHILEFSFQLRYYSIWFLQYYLFAFAYKKKLVAFLNSHSSLNVGWYYDLTLLRNFDLFELKFIFHERVRNFLLIRIVKYKPSWLLLCFNFFLI